MEYPTPQDSPRHEEFVSLYVRHEAALFSFVLTMVRHTADAEDVVQRASMTMWRCFNKFTPGMLQSNGYSTAAIGKYHVGMAFDDGHGQAADEFDYHDVDFTKPLLDGPTHHGFDEFFGVPGNMEDPLDTEPRVFIRNDRWIFELDKKSLTPPEARLRLL
jgi:hypothetical protein